MCAGCSCGQLRAVWTGLVRLKVCTTSDVSRNNGRLSELPRSSLDRLVSMTSRLNWLLCCMITQGWEARKHAVLSYGEADMGGARTGKECPDLLCKASWVLGQGARIKVGTKLLKRYLWCWEEWCLSQFGWLEVVVCHQTEQASGIK